MSRKAYKTYVKNVKKNLSVELITRKIVDPEPKSIRDPLCRPGRI